MNDFSTTDYIILVIVHIEMVVSCGVNAWASWRAPRPSNILYGCISGLSFFMFLAYFYLWFNLEDSAQWVKVMRGVTIFNYAIVWIAPGIVWSRVLTKRRLLTEQLTQSQKQHPSTI